MKNSLYVLILAGLAPATTGYAQIQNVPSPAPLRFVRNVEPCGGLRAILSTFSVNGQNVVANTPLPILFPSRTDPCYGFRENNPVWLAAHAVSSVFGQNGASVGPIALQNGNLVLTAHAEVDSPFVIESRMIVCLDLDGDERFDDATERFGVGNPPATASRPYRGIVYRHDGQVTIPRPSGGFLGTMRARMAVALLGMGTNLPPSAGDLDFGWSVDFLLTVTPSRPAEFAMNTDDASLAIDGVTGGRLRLARSTLSAPADVTLQLDSARVGANQGWFLLVGSRPVVARSAGALVTAGGQIINVDLTDPALVAIVAVGFSRVALELPCVGPTTLSTQLGVLAPAHVDGLVLSQPFELVVR